MTQLLCYVAGPLTADDPELMRIRRIRARAFGNAVADAAGCTVFVPHDEIQEPADLTGEDLWQWAMAACLEKLRTCDLIVLMEDWRISRGARIEHDQALTWGIPVAYSLPEAVGIVKGLQHRPMHRGLMAELIQKEVEIQKLGGRTA